MGANEEPIKTIDVVVSMDNATGDVHVRGPQNTLLCYGILSMALETLREIRADAMRSTRVIPIAGKDVPFPGGNGFKLG